MRMWPPKLNYELVGQNSLAGGRGCEFAFMTTAHGGV